MNEEKITDDSALVRSLKKQVTELTLEVEKAKKELASCAAEHDRMTDALEVLITKYAAALAAEKERHDA